MLLIKNKARNLSRLCGGLMLFTDSPYASNRDSLPKEYRDDVSGATLRKVSQYYFLFGYAVSVPGVSTSSMERVP